MLFISILMILLFGSLANSYKITGGVATGIGRFFEPIVIYIRDEIAIPNIGKNIIKLHELFINYFLFYMVFKSSWINPLGINVTGNIAVTFSTSFVNFFDY